MGLTTLCYIEKDDKYLMLLRNKKKKDVNKNKWIGVGGHFEENETPEECLLREVKEETGLSLTTFSLRSVITFRSEGWETEYMFLYTATEFQGELIPCDEGELRWIEKKNIGDLNLWEGDRIFLRLLDEKEEFYTMTLSYEGDNLVECKMDGKEFGKYPQERRIKDED